MNKNIWLISKFFKHDVNSVARRFGYSDENLLILNNDWSTLSERYPEVVTHLNKKNTQERADTRGRMEFLQNLVVNWTLEDFLMRHFCTLGYPSELSGEDRDRKVCIKHPDSTPDLMVLHKEKQWFVEVKADYSGNKFKDGILHIKKVNYESIKDFEAHIFYVDIISNQYVLVPPCDIVTGVDFQNPHMYGGKPMKEIKTGHLEKHPLDININLSPLVINSPRNYLSKPILF